MHGDPETSQRKSAAEAERRHAHCSSRTYAFEPAPKECGGQSEEDDRRAEDPADGADFPIIGRGAGKTNRLRQRQRENAECVGLSDAEMNREGRRWYPPAIEASGGNCVVAMQECGELEHVGSELDEL